MTWVRTRVRLDARFGATGAAAKDKTAGAGDAAAAAGQDATRRAMTMEAAKMQGAKMQAGAIKAATIKAATIKTGAAPAATGRAAPARVTARRALALVLAAAVLAVAALLALRAPAAEGAEAAHFAVTDEVVSPGFGPFTATVDGFGAGARLVWGGSGFEPIVARTRWLATEDAPDRIIAAPEEVGYWDTLKSGAFDGASVEIYRISDGRLERVRTDRIAAGGHQASGWKSALPDASLLAPGARSFDYAFAPWHRPSAESWFAVQAVAADGAVSAPSAAASASSPAELPATMAATDPDLVAAPAGLARAEAPAPAGGPAPPEGLVAEATPDGRVRLSWNAAADPGAGWRVLISDDPPAAMQGYFGVLEGGAAGEPIRKGDLAILSKTFDTASRKAFHTNRVWGAWGDNGLSRQMLVNFFPDEDPARTWRLLPHEADTPVEDAGATYLEFDLARDARARIGLFNNAGPDQFWYEVLEPGRTYLIEVWARADRPKKLNFVVEGPHYAKPGVATLQGASQMAGPQWRKYVARFTPNTVFEGPGLGWMGVEVEGPGKVAFDNFRVYPEDAAWLDLDAVDYERLADSGVDALRTHGLVKTFRRTYDLGQLTNPGGATGIDLMNTLPQTLGIAERAGVEPWLQIEPHLSPEEWSGFVEYLAAPAPAPGEAQSRPWAAKRAAQGRAAPWTDAFDRIYLEIGNETWNGIFAPWIFPSMPDAATGEGLSPGAVYGLFQEQVIRTLRASPWWEAAGLEDKVVFVLGGWGGASYGRDAARVSPSSDLLTIAAYNGGWDAGKGPPQATPQGFFEVLNDVSQSAVRDADRLAGEATEISAARGRPLGVGTYEAGPGYVLNGLNGDVVTEAQAEEQERVMKSVAAGTATLDAFLARAERGFGVQNFFVFGEGRTWRSHARRIEGGQAHPAWELLGLYAGLDAGEMLRVETLATPRADVPATAWREAVPDAPLAGAYAARAGDRLTLTLISRQVPGAPGWSETQGAGLPVTVDLPFARAAKVTRRRMDGPFDAENIAGPNVRPVVEPLPEGWFADGRLSVPALPPGQAEIYVFEGIEE